jgi:hypothetical protein
MRFDCTTGYRLDLSSTGVRLVGCANFDPPIALSNNIALADIPRAASGHDKRGEGVLWERRLRCRYS